MTRIPRQLPGRDIKSLPLQPTEAFVLSRIDASVTEHDLSVLTGLSPEAVASILDRLHVLGAIDFVSGGAPSRRPRSVRPLPSQPAAARRTDIPPEPPPLRPFFATPPLYDPAELDEDVEIDRERKRRILDFYYRLDELDHYQLLGVPQHADKRQVKSAYYTIAPDFHPDRYFRKRLGSYKAKIEAVFARLTLAHDVLTSKEERAAYDEYLAQTRRNRAMSALLDHVPRDVATVEAAVDESAVAALREGDGGFERPGRYGWVAESERARDGRSARPSGGIILRSSTAPGPSPTVPPSARPAPPGGGRPEPVTVRPAPPGAGRPKSVTVRPEPPPKREPDPPPIPVRVAPLGEEERRDALRRKLLGGGPPSSGRHPAAPPPPASDPSPGAPSSRDPKAAAATLKARYEAAVQAARRQQIERFVESARAAMERGDLAAAANGYRIASSLDPENAELAALARDTQQAAAAHLAEGYLKQAEYEASQGHWAEAAASYANVCAGRPDDAHAHERVAFATLKSQGNPRRAVEYARRAVELAPRVPEYRLTLARAYQAAGFEKSARGEIRRAAELAPNDGKIQEILAQAVGEAQKKLK